MHGYSITVNHRESYGMCACNGVLLNQESSRGGESFVARKIPRASAALMRGWRRSSTWVSRCNGERSSETIPKISSSPASARKVCAASLLAFLNSGARVDVSIRVLAEKVSATVSIEGLLVWDITKQDETSKNQLDVIRLGAMGLREKIRLDRGLTLLCAAFCKVCEASGFRG